MEEDERGINVIFKAVKETGKHGPRAVWVTDISMRRFKMAHKISSRANGQYAMHRHNFYELLYVVSGDVNIATPEEEYIARPGSLLIVEPGAEHAVLVYTDEPYERYTLHFDPECLSAERKMLLLSGLQSAVSGGKGPAAARVCPDMARSGVCRLLEAFETLKNCAPEALDALYPIYIEAILAAVLARSAPAKEKQDAPEPESVRFGSDLQRSMVAWIDRHYTQPVTLGMLAETFYLSKGYVGSLFKQAAGCTVKEYVNNKRMAHVQVMLSAGVPPAQAALRAGFRSYTTFYRSYVRKFGYSPRRDIRETKDSEPARAFLSDFSIRYRQDEQAERARQHIGGQGREDDPMMSEETGPNT